MKLMSVGELLKDGYLEPSGMSLNELASKLEVSPSSLSRVITGKSVLTVEMAIKLESVWPRKAYTWLHHQLKHQLQEVGYYD
ncbi:plasmid antitoxin with HTH domain [Vibrio phage qdvp001]|uniref:plasmid antitoxin with HTH domain n=1 Tax=Vibrio phage qdvp001 TaxID=1003177 RepID=UPI0007222BA9|nr:plasmid antitoxin with HTH domain [Vibrio phage qdvp001]ALM62141.1 XRE family transcriptional regulator [Vibrio phage qdvp001]